MKAEEYPLGIKINGKEMPKKEEAMERWMFLR